MLSLFYCSSSFISLSLFSPEKQVSLSSLTHIISSLFDCPILSSLKTFLDRLLPAADSVLPPSPFSFLRKDDSEKQR